MRLAAALLAFAVTARLLTWEPIAHGDRSRHIRVTFLGGAAAAAVAAGARALAGRSSSAPIVWTAAVLLAADVPHYARFAHPVTRGAPLVSVPIDLRDEASLRRSWDVETSGAGAARVSGGILTLESPPGASAFVIARVPALPDPRRNWFLPVSLLERERTERLEWRGAVSRTGTFYVIAELRRLLIQAVSYGLHVTYPDEREQLRGHEIPLPAASEAQDWLIERTTARVSLSVDGRQLWSAPSREPLSQIRLGETKQDPQHAGSLRLERLSYAVLLDRS